MLRRYEHHIHEPPTNPIWKYVFSYDHKIIGIQFLIYALFFLAVGGLLAMMIRWQLAWPASLPGPDGTILGSKPFPILGMMLWPNSGGIMPPDFYNIAVTMHGSIMVFFAISPLLAGAFGNFLIPLQIGARDMAFPFLNMLSFWTMVPAGILMIASFFVEGGAAQSGWTAYAPLSTVAAPGLGQSLWLLGIILAGVASIMGGTNYITTIILYRAPGMTMMRLPLTIWGLFFTAVLNVLYLPVVASGFMMLLLDRHLMTTFFTTGVYAAAEGFAPGGQVLLYQHIFWVFGHPEVYIVILPAWGMVSDLLSFFARKPAFGYRETVLAMGMICVLSTVVWGHHMFVSGMNPYLGRVFSMATFMVSIPSAILFLNWLGTLYKGSIRFTTPMLFSLSVIFVFGLGGLTGLFNGSQGLDLYLHDSYFVVGHFHFTMAASVFLGGLGAVYFWFPKMFGRMMNEPLGKVHWLLTTISVTIVFAGMMYVGAYGHMRRVADPAVYQFLHPMLKVNTMVSMAAFCAFFSQALFAANLIHGFFAGPPAGDNPWECTTLEWSLSSPPKPHNFDEIPTVHHGPFEYNNPEIDDKDWLGQWEPPIGGLPEAPEAGASDDAGEEGEE